MSFDGDRALIEQYFIDNLSGVSLRFEGQDYKNDDLPFAGVMVEPINRKNTTINNDLKVVDGFIRVRIFTERGAGTKSILDICDDVATMIDNATTGAVTTYAAGAPTVLDTEDAYLAKEISIPYYSDA